MAPIGDIGVTAHNYPHDLTRRSEQIPCLLAPVVARSERMLGNMLIIRIPWLSELPSIGSTAEVYRFLGILVY